MKHRRIMPYGAEVRPDRSTLFRLWAPSEASIRLSLVTAEGELLLPMNRTEDGCFELETARAGPGDLYKFVLHDGFAVPDPASRYQPHGVHGRSQIIDPCAYDWTEDGWRGRPWAESVLYELHVGTFTQQGTYAAMEAKLDYLADLGVTMLEIMPLSESPGRRNWGYDGVYPFAPEQGYGTVEELKHLIEACHARRLSVILDVVWNHFGPEGNYIGRIAPEFFTSKHKTPWGDALNFDDEGSAAVRSFYTANALYWLEEFRFDGLRIDAIHTIQDCGEQHILSQIVEAVRPLRAEREIHLVVENEHNGARWLERDQERRPKLFTAQWNDDVHHALHVLVTGETDAYYVDFAEQPAEKLGRALAEGFAYQGEASVQRDGTPRGESSLHVPVEAFISFLQNHDQTGNRPMGERIACLAEPAALKAAVAILLLAPAPPLLFMGEEWGCTQPFPFFCDFGEELSAAIRTAREREYAIAAKYKDPAVRARIPDPTAETTFTSAQLDWSALEQPEHAAWLALYRDLLALRAAEIAPRIPRVSEPSGRWSVRDGRVVEVSWPLEGGGALTLLANMSADEKPAGPAGEGQLLYASHTPDAVLPPWFVALRVTA